MEVPLVVQCASGTGCTTGGGTYFVVLINGQGGRQGRDKEEGAKQKQGASDDTHFRAWWVVSQN